MRIYWTKHTHSPSAPWLSSARSSARSSGPHQTHCVSAHAHSMAHSMAHAHAHGTHHGTCIREGVPVDDALVVEVLEANNDLGAVELDVLGRRSSPSGGGRTAHHCSHSPSQSRACLSLLCRVCVCVRGACRIVSACAPHTRIQHAREDVPWVWKE